jgi:hypothetical protein
VSAVPNNKYQCAPRPLTDSHPAALSDPESSGDEQIPPQKKGKATKPEPAQVEEVDNEENEEEAEDDEEGAEDE